MNPTFLLDHRKVATMSITERGAHAPPGPKPEFITGRPTLIGRSLMYLFIGVPFIAALMAIPVAWIGGWCSPIDLALLVVFYCTTTAGIGSGFHRYFTHGAFKANRGLKIALAVAGSLAVEGSVIGWVADHRRHHKYSDKAGDPHSPWRYGTTTWALTKGLWFAHVGWMFSDEHTAQQTNPQRFAADLLDDRDLVTITRAFPGFVVFSLVFPPLFGGLVTWSWHGAITALFWGTLVRMALMHHVTWSTNSIAHRFGEQPFDSRDHSTNVWWLALFSFGESWHNLHHTFPSWARHGVEKGQVDINARLIWLFEKLGWATNVHWPDGDKLDRRRLPQPG